MKEKFKSYYHKFINYLKSNWVKVLCIFIVVVYFVCGIVSFYKKGSSLDDPLKNDTSIPITSTYKVINKKQAIQSEDTIVIGDNEFNQSLLQSHDVVLNFQDFDKTSFSSIGYLGGTFSFDINFKGTQRKLITFSWSNRDQLLIKFYYNDVVISELDEFIVDYSYSFNFSSNGNVEEVSTLRCTVTPSYVDKDNISPTVSYWNIGIYDMTPYFDYAYNLGKDFGYDNGYTIGFDAGEKAGHDAGYQAGYDEGELVGAQHGYDQGYTQGKKEGKNEGLTEGEQKGYQNGFNAGKTEGLHEGERKGYNDGLTAGREAGYKNGYDEGYSAGSSVIQVKDVFIDILEAPFNILKNAFNFEILGINFSSILVGVVSILLVGFVIRKVI